MGFYSRFILPRLINCACGAKTITYQRRKVVPLAEGIVLEVGIGSGLNLPFYDSEKVTRVLGLEPSAEMRKIAERAANDANVDVELLDCPGEDIPLDDDCVDTVLLTYTLCTIPDAPAALIQMSRVLKPGGRLIFCEHGASPDPSVRRWQNRVDPLWKRIAGGCHLNRPIPDLITNGGFQIDEIDTMYVPGWRPASFNYWGTAAHA